MADLKKTIIIVLLALFVAISTIGINASAQQRGKRRQGPPPEAYTACEGKSEGDAAEFEGPRGETVTGTCELDGDSLVLRPDNPPDHRGRDEKN